MLVRTRSFGIIIGLGAVLGLASQLAACGNCGDPGTRRPGTRRAVSGTFGATSGASDPVAPSRVRTAGGVVLEGVPDGVAVAAKRLSRERDAAVNDLVALGAPAKDAVLKLLTSKNLSELRGAIACVVADGDPIGLRADALEALLPLATHDAQDVREAARAAIEAVADVNRLVETLGSSLLAARMGAVRILASWDGAVVQTALAARFEDADLGFAREAMLAATATGKAPSPVVSEAAQKLIVAGGERSAIGLRALHRMGVTIDAKALQTVLGSSDPQLLSEAIRIAGRTLSPEQRGVFVVDTRVEVRRALAEVTVDPADLAILTHDADVTVRASAIGGLARAGAEVDRLATLTPFLKDPDLVIQRSALAAIADGARPEAAVRTIQEWSATTAPEHKVFAIAALGRIEDRSAVDALIGLVANDGLGPYAQAALGALSGETHGLDLAAWNAWRDRKYPPVPDGPAPK